MAEIYVGKADSGKCYISKNRKGFESFCLFPDGTWRYLAKLPEGKDSVALYASREEAELIAASVANFAVVFIMKGSSDKEMVFSDADRAPYALRDFLDKFPAPNGLIAGPLSPAWVGVYRAENIGQSVTPVLEWSVPLPIAC